MLLFGTDYVRNCVAGAKKSGGCVTCALQGMRPYAGAWVPQQVGTGGGGPMMGPAAYAAGAHWYQPPPPGPTGASRLPSLRATALRSFADARSSNVWWHSQASCALSEAEAL